MLAGAWRREGGGGTVTSGFGVDPVALGAAAARLRVRADGVAEQGARVVVPGDGDFGAAHPGHAAALAQAVQRLDVDVQRCAAALRDHADSLDEAARRYATADVDAVAALAAAEGHR